MRLTVKSVKFIMLSAVLAMVAGCVGQRAREEVLGPQILNHWQLLRDAAAPGTDPSPAFTEALRAGDRLRVRAEWMAARQAVLDAIEAQLEAGAISARYALSLQEGVLRMDQAVEVYARR